MEYLRNELYYIRFYNEELLINLMDVSITNVAWVRVFAFQKKENDGPQGPFFSHS